MSILDDAGRLSSHKARLGLRIGCTTATNTYTTSCKLQRLMEEKLVDVFPIQFDRDVLISKQIHRLKTVDELLTAIDLVGTMSSESLLIEVQAKRLVPTVRSLVDEQNKKEKQALEDLEKISLEPLMEEIEVFDEDDE